MSELCSADEIVEKIKDIISKPKGNKKVFDGDAAGVLNLTCGNLATMKKRNKVPYKEILLFCDRVGLDPRDIVFKKQNC
ncbi:hypothetical protein [Sulfurimonas sp.]